MAVHEEEKEEIENGVGEIDPKLLQRPRVTLLGCLPLAKAAVPNCHRRNCIRRIKGLIQRTEQPENFGRRPNQRRAPPAGEQLPSPYIACNMDYEPTAQGKPTGIIMAFKPPTRSSNKDYIKHLPCYTNTLIICHTVGLTQLSFPRSGYAA